MGQTSRTASRARGPDWSELDRNLDKLDRAALKRCIEYQHNRHESPRRQIENMLEDRPWLEAAEFACYSAQMDTFGLRPWMTPPV